MLRKQNVALWSIGAIVIFLVQGVVLWSFGQPPICTCGYVKLWEGVVLSAGNSQHLTDWYTFSHVIHGFLFYGLSWLLFPRVPFGTRLLFAIFLEAGWEIFENTPWLIAHYREQALAQGYVGDSIINSLMDTAATVVGFVFARFAPVSITIFVALGFEVFVGLSIKDNLTLNIINLIHQFDFVSRWQSGE